jgi:hypothetical protein
MTIHREDAELMLTALSILYRCPTDTAQATAVLALRDKMHDRIAQGLHPSRIRRFFQDGGHFYDADDRTLAFDYTHLVRDDQDTEGAAAARTAFLEQYPSYQPADEEGF